MNYTFNEARTVIHKLNGSVGVSRTQLERMVAAKLLTIVETFGGKKLITGDSIGRYNRKVRGLQKKNLRHGGHVTPSPALIPAKHDAISDVMLDWLRTVEFGKGLGTKEVPCIEAALNCALGNEFSDTCPECVEPMIHRAAIRVNDSWVWESNAERTDALMPLLFAQLGTARSGRELAIRARLVDFAVTVATPAWLRAAGLTGEAERCEALPSWSEATRDQIRAALREVRAAAAAAAADAYAADAAAAYAADAAYAAAADAAAAYAADAAAAAAWREKNRPLAKDLLTRFVGVLMECCALAKAAT